MPDGLAEVADAVAARIAEGWADPAPAAVSVEWELYTPLDGLDAVEGRRVWVVPGGYGSDGPATRVQDLNEYGVAVVVVERYTDAAGSPPNEWVAERVAWVREQVYEKVGRLNADNPELLAGAWWPQTANTITPADHEMLRKGVFWSELLFTFRREE